MEYFEIYLNSADALFGSTTPHSCRFNLGTVNNFVPNAQIYQNNNCCYVKVKYFSVEETVTAFNTLTVGTLLIEMGGGQPNSIKSNLMAVGSTNMEQSNIIGLVPTNITKNTYSTSSYENDYVKAPNILNGDILINLKDQDGVLLTLTGSKPWVMLLSVGYEKEHLY
tara:strand:- start:337 stop:837 length:501 start_codon:yes stop_codon:yes gene_type:complete